MITILDIAIAEGARQSEHGLDAREFERLGLPFFGGCQICGATLGPYNAHPGRNGFLIGKCCVEPEDTFETVVEYRLEEERHVLYRWGKGHALSQCVSEIMKANRDYEEMYEDVARFHAPSECYPSGEKLAQDIDAIAGNYGYGDIDGVIEELVVRCGAKVAYRLGL